jgi:transposase
LIEDAAPALIEARELMAAFHALIRQKKVQALDGWLSCASASLISAFARGLANDQLAVRAAISTAWSNAQA